MKDNEKPSPTEALKRDGLWSLPQVQEAAEMMLTVNFAQMGFEERLEAVELASRREQAYAKRIAKEN